MIHTEMSCVRGGVVTWAIHSTNRPRRWPRSTRWSRPPGRTWRACRTGWCTTGPPSRCWRELGGPLPDQGIGHRGGRRATAADRDGDRDRIRRAAVLPFRDRRLDPGRAGRRLGRVPARPERVRPRLVAARRRGGDGHAGLAARARRPASGLGRRADRECHLRQPHRSGAGHPLVGRAARRRCRPRPGWPACRGCRCSSGGYVHPSARKALQMLGHGKDTVEVFVRDDIGRIDLAAVRRAWASWTERPRCWSRRRGSPTPASSIRWPTSPTWPRSSAPGCTSTRRSACSPRCHRAPPTSPRASSAPTPLPPTPTSGSTCRTRVVSRWSGSPTGSARRSACQARRTCQARTTPRGGYGLLGPESSRRARALPIWATLAAYGRAGYQALVERHCDLAQHLAAAVDAAPDLERLAEVPLNVVCFRYRPPGLWTSRS